MKQKIDFQNIKHKKTMKNSDGEDVKKTVLDEISFTIDEGDVFAVMGPSGSGKTSLLRLLNRLEDPMHGNILIDGKNILQYPVVELRRKVGLVFQIPYMFEGSVLDNLLYGPNLAGEKPEDKKKQVMELLPWFGFKEDMLGRDPDRLSVGEKHRVNILRTLMNDPDVIMLDEPTSSLDPGSARNILELVKDINQKKNKTIVLVTHIPEHARMVSNKALILIDGKIVEKGTVEEVFDNPGASIARNFLEGKTDIGNGQE
ncbi:MAG: ATP-binding cassette domain-containing protein [Candidatus Eremiobacteraeota bacterium]|nr:ATP-binding cassette domain-containing protein [Candidatus Eremiobacteraeota bacterium]